MYYERLHIYYRNMYYERLHIYYRNGFYVDSDEEIYEPETEPDHESGSILDKITPIQETPYKNSELEDIKIYVDISGNSAPFDISYAQYLLNYLANNYLDPIYPSQTINEKPGLYEISGSLLENIKLYIDVSTCDVNYTQYMLNWLSGSTDSNYTLTEFENTESFNDNSYNIYNLHYSQEPEPEP